MLSHHVPGWLLYEPSGRYIGSIVGADQVYRSEGNQVPIESGSPAGPGGGGASSVGEISVGGRAGGVTSGTRPAGGAGSMGIAAPTATLALGASPARRGGSARSALAALQTANASSNDCVTASCNICRLLSMFLTVRCLFGGRSLNRSAPGRIPLEKPLRPSQTIRKDCVESSAKPA